MANFQPLKDRFVRILEDSFKVFQIKGCFIDFGCGRGDVAEHLIRNPVFREGYAYDLAVSEDQIRAGGSRPGGGRLQYSRKLEELPASADVAVLLDVIEHVPEPDGLLGDIAAHIRPEGWLILTVPYNHHEWGVDDDFYGHLRRLSRRGMVSLLENHGWNVIRLLDPTYPSFWFIRRVYLWWRRLAGPAAKSGAEAAPGDFEKTLHSARQSAWEYKGVIPRLLGSSLMPWNLVHRFDLYFQSIFHGFDLFAVCQKRTSSRRCGVCLNGQFTYHRFFQGYSLQKCTYCSTEKMLTPVDQDAESRKGLRMRRAVLNDPVWAVRSRRLRRLCRLPVEEKSMAVITREGGLPTWGPENDGWKIELATASELMDAQGRVRWPKDARSFGIVALLHVIELVEDADEALGLLKDLVAPGGYAYLEFPNSRSWLKKLLQWRWFGYDPPHHRYVIDPESLADRLGMGNFHLVKESGFAVELSFLIFAQSLINTAFPFQRDALLHWLAGRTLSGGEAVMAWISAPLLLFLLPLYALYQPLASLFRSGCVIRQLYRRTDIRDSSMARAPWHGRQPA